MDKKKNDHKTLALNGYINKKCSRCFTEISKEQAELTRKCFFAYCKKCFKIIRKNGKNSQIQMNPINERTKIAFRGLAEQISNSYLIKGDSNVK